MNTENETRTTICHPAPSGKGSAIRFTLHPAHGNVSGCVMCEIAKQKTAASVTGETPTFATFDWDSAIAMKLCVSDIAQMLMVFRGMQESIADGKGLFHRTAEANMIVKFTHMIEPCPCYSLEISRKPLDGELDTAHFAFRMEEAIWLSTAIEASMGVLVFGVPSAV